MAERLILASASSARAAMLRAAGIAFSIEPANLDEGAVKRHARDSDEPALACAAMLAAAKACLVSEHFPAAFVVGGDQILAVGEEWFDKPRDRAEARAQLLRLRGRAHRLATAVCVARGGMVLWRAESAPELTMRRFSEAFLDAYLMAEGELILGSVGAYCLEGRGAQLFSRINGDHFAVLGLPLIELLSFLRSCGMIPE